MDKNDPNRIFIYVWIGYILSGMFFLRNIYTFSGYFFLYVFIVCGVLMFSSQIAKTIAIIKVNKSRKEYILNEKRSIRLLCIILMLGMLFPFLSLKLHGFSITNILSLDNLLSLNNEISAIRYSDVGFIKSTLSQILLIFVYCAPLYGGFLYAQVNGKYKKYCIVTLLPSFLTMATQSTKLPFIFSVLSWGIAYFACSIFKSQSIWGTSKLKTMAKLLIIIFSFFGVVFTSMVFKTGKIDDTMIDITKSKFISYSLGELPLADIWFDKYMQESKHNYDYGIKTFYGISNLLNISERKQGVYTEYIVYGKYKGRYLESNVFTYFRNSIEDFGMIGSIFFFFIIGIIASSSYYRIQAKRYIFFSIIILKISLCSYCFLYAPVATVYTSTLSAFILLYFILKLSYHSIVKAT
jgi:oligosaccharide repeat unit polymerase